MTTFNPFIRLNHVFHLLEIPPESGAIRIWYESA